MTDVDVFISRANLAKEVWEKCFAKSKLKYRYHNHKGDTLLERSAANLAFILGAILTTKEDDLNRSALNGWDDNYLRKPVILNLSDYDDFDTFSFLESIFDNDHDVWKYIQISSWQEK